MILIVGAFASGKRSYARSLGFSDSDIVADAQELVRAETDIASLADELAVRPVVLCVEVGCGVVPVDASERAWRERAGRLAVELASRADAVVRMVCGIPTPLKGRAGSPDAAGRLDSAPIELTLVRHGQTPGNAERRYVGGTDDQPLSELGREQARKAREAGSFPRVPRVYVSPMRRARETADLLFPGAEQVVVEDVREMDFGDFSGRTADEMADDADYRAWVEGGCASPCPNGESRAEFDGRVCRALEGLLREAAVRGEERVVLVAHGGTMMAALPRFTGDPRPFHEWLLGNCGAYRIRVDLEGPSLRFEVLEAVECSTKMGL